MRWNAGCRSFPTCQGGARSRFGTGDWAECFDGILVFVVTGVLDSNQSVSSLLHQIWEKAAVAKGDEEEEEVRCQETVARISVSE